jgi:hypothetical protein
MGWLFWYVYVSPLEIWTMAEEAAVADTSSSGSDSQALAVGSREPRSV